MTTPIYDKMWPKFTEVQKSAYGRGKTETLMKVLAMIGEQSKPTHQLKQLTKALEAELAKVKA